MKVKTRLFSRPMGLITDMASTPDRASLRLVAHRMLEGRYSVAARLKPQSAGARMFQHELSIRAQ